MKWNALMILQKYDRIFFDKCQIDLIYNVSDFVKKVKIHINHNLMPTADYCLGINLFSLTS